MSPISELKIDKQTVQIWTGYILWYIWKKGNFVFLDLCHLNKGELYTAFFQNLTEKVFYFKWQLNKATANITCNSNMSSKFWNNLESNFLILNIKSKQAFGKNSESEV